MQFPIYILNVFSGNRQRTQSWAGSTHSFGGSSENLVASQSRLTAAEHYKPVMDGSKSHKHHGANPRDIDARSSQRSNHRHHDLEQYEYMNGGKETGGTEMFVRSANDTFNEFVGKYQKKSFFFKISQQPILWRCVKFPLNLENFGKWSETWKRDGPKFYVRDVLPGDVVEK